MFRKIHIFIGACLFSMLLSVQAPVFARDLTAGAEQPDQTFWLTIRDTTLPDLFEMFIKRYPDSSYRVEAERRLMRLKGSNQLSAMDQARQLMQTTPGRGSVQRSVARAPNEGTRSPALAAPVLTPLAAQTFVPASGVPSKTELVPLQDQVLADDEIEQLPEEVSEDVIILIQHNLNRVGCSVGTLDGKWGVKSQTSAARFARIIDQPLVTAMPNADLLSVLKGYEEGTCAPVKAKPRVKKYKKARISPTYRSGRKAKKLKRRKKTAKKKTRIRRKARRAKKKVARKAKKHKKVKTASSVRKRRKKKRIYPGSSGQSVNVPIIVLQAGGLGFGGGRRPGRGGSNGGGGQFYIKRN